jgi:predicted Zn-dependent protease
MNRQQVLYPLLILSFSLSLASCATTEPVSSPTGPDVADSSREMKSRALYQYSRARLRLLEGDTDGALLLIGTAIDEDPDAAYLQYAAAGIYLKTNRLQEIRGIVRPRSSWQICFPW